MGLIKEEWRPVPMHEGAYEVSNHGRVRSLDRTIITAIGSSRLCKGRVLRPGRMLSGHLSVVLGRSTGSVCVHMMVLAAFVGPRPPKTEARHRNGNPADNRLANLEWASRSRNTLDKKWHALPKNYRLRPADVRAIRKQRAAGVKLRVLAEKYGVSLTTVSKVARKITQGDVA